MTNTTEDEGKKWKHRRRMAYSSLAGLFVILISVLANPEGTQSVAEILTSLGYAFAAVVMSYMGLSTFEHFGKGK